MEKCKYKIIDGHNIYQCEACGYIVELEADGPFEERPRLLRSLRPRGRASLPV